MGAGGSTWLQRKVKRTVQAKVAALVPAAVISSVSEKAKSVSSRARVAVKGAVADGRSAARDREQELRADLERKRLSPRR
jgi:rRNA-processing protein FCF1